MTYHEIGVLNGCLVVHWTEEVFTERQDHELLEEAITEHELLCGTRDVPIVVQNAHASETSDLNLQGDVSAQIHVHLRLFCSECTSVVRSSLPDRCKALVSNLINHVRRLIINNYKYIKLYYKKNCQKEEKNQKVKIKCNQVVLWTI